MMNLHIAFFLGLTFDVLVLGARLLACHSILPVDDGLRRAMFESLGAILHPQKCDYLLLLESLPRARFDQVNPQLDIIAAIDDIVHEAFFWRNSHELVELCYSVICNLNLNNVATEDLSASAQMVPEMWTQEVLRRVDAEGAGAQLMEIIKRAFEPSMPFIRSYIREEFQMFRPLLYSLSRWSTHLSYDCKKMVGYALMDPVHHPQSQVFDAFFRHPVFTQVIAKTLTCTDTRSTAETMESLMNQYDRAMELRNQSEPIKVVEEASERNPIHIVKYLLARRKAFKNSMMGAVGATNKMGSTSENPSDDSLDYVEEVKYPLHRGGPEDFFANHDRDEYPVDTVARHKRELHQNTLILSRSRSQFHESAPRARIGMSRSTSQPALRSYKHNERRSIVEVLSTMDDFELPQKRAKYY